MSIMTKDQYDERKTSLASAISHAEGEFQSASFKELTSKGSKDESTKAKRHLDLLREEMERVEAAWIASQAEVERLWVKSVVDNFDAVAAEIDALLAERKKALRDVIKATDAVTRALARYHDATDNIRSKAWALAQKTQGGASTIGAQVTGSLGIDVAAKVFSAMLRTAHIAPSLTSFLRDAFPNGDAVAQEEQLAGNVRAAIRFAAPQTEAA